MAREVAWFATQGCRSKIRAGLYRDGFAGMAVPDLHDEALFVRPGLVPDIHPLSGAFSGLPGQARS
jgi:hypothetical protein